MLVTVSRANVTATLRDREKAQKSRPRARVALDWWALFSQWGAETRSSRRGDDDEARAGRCGRRGAADGSRFRGRRDPHGEAAPAAGGDAPEDRGRTEGAAPPARPAEGNRPGDAEAGRADGRGDQDGDRRGEEGGRAAGLAQAHHR